MSACAFGRMRAMGTWTMRLGDDGEGIDPPPLPYEDWVPRPVALGAVRAVSMVIRGFYGLPADPMLVAWDDDRATVRLANGDLRWYIDAARQAFPRQGKIAVVDANSVYPRGNRYMDALAVRSLQDLIERASGVEGNRQWRLDVIATRLLEEAQVLLEPTHVAPPTL
jgi:hypothetical protein